MGCIVDNSNTIINIIVCVPELLEQFGAKPWYDGAKIGDSYSPPPELPSMEERIQLLETENSLLKAQLQAQGDRSDFIEDCIAEMAMQVYAE